MERRRVRIGDVIDDYCTRCRLIMNHGVAAMVGDDVRKVRCNTCMSEHVYKHGKVPARKRRETEKLFAEVLRGLGREPDDPNAVAEPEADRETGPDAVPQADETRASVDDAPEGDDLGTADEGESGAAGAADDSTADDSTADDNAAAAGGATPPGTGTEADRPADALHGVRRKLYTIRNFSGGKAPAGGGPTDGSVGGAPPIGGGPMGRGGRHDAGGRPHGGGHGGGGRHGGGRHGGRRHGGGHGGGHSGGHGGGYGGGGGQGGRRGR